MSFNRQGLLKHLEVEHEATGIAGFNVNTLDPQAGARMEYNFFFHSKTFLVLISIQASSIIVLLPSILSSVQLQRALKKLN